MAGLMYFWDLTIDTVSVVVLVIAVGLSVDYASHVGHTFLVKSGTRNGKKSLHEYFTFINYSPF